jgi:hypothetical protein
MPWSRVPAGPAYMRTIGMSHQFLCTRADAEVWRDDADAMVRNVQAYQKAIQEGCNPAELEQLRMRASTAAWKAWGSTGVGLASPDWEDFAGTHPAVAEALVPFAKAMGEIPLNELGEAWDGTQDFPWLAEVVRTLAALTAALDGREGPRAKPKLFGGSDYEVVEPVTVICPPGTPSTIDGEEVPPLTEQQYATLRALAEAHQRHRRLSLVELIRESSVYFPGNDYPNNLLTYICENVDERWKRVVSRGIHQGYGLNGTVTLRKSSELHK